MLKMLSALLVASLLGGCASMGYKIADAQPAFEPQEPWQAVVLWRMDIRKEQSLAVVRVPLSEPLPTVWRWEMNDHRRTYLTANGEERVLSRSVWSAYVFDGDTKMVVRYNAVLNPARTGMFVLVPGGKEDAQKLLTQNLLLFSADACFVQTTKQEIVPLVSNGNGKKKLPDGFFRNHPSPITPNMMYIMDGTTKTGMRFLEDLRRRFPKLVSGAHSARSDVADVATLTSEGNLIDRFISKGSAPIGASILAGGLNPITVINMIVRNREVFAGGVCKDPHEQLGLKLDTDTVSWQSIE